MPNVGNNWKCSYCGHAQVIDRQRHHYKPYSIFVEGWQGDRQATLWRPLFARTRIAEN
jgi:hypothetical protein